MDYGKLGTEQCHTRSAALDSMKSLEIVSLMNELDIDAIAAVKLALPQIARTADEAANRIPRGGRVIYMGAGTSGRLAVLDASECPPTFGVSDQTVIGIIAGGDGALRKAVEGAEDSEVLAREDLERIGLKPEDMVIAISASGTAPYCIGALKTARNHGALAVSMCCNPNTKLSAHADIAIEMPTGAEVLSGSTRLRAGTATKMALNMISTAAMVRLGKVYGNLMVDVSASNGKLRDRAVRITMQATQTDRETAETLLRSADGNIKRAIVMHESGCALDVATRALVQSGGFVRTAIETAKQNKEKQ